MSPKVPFAVMAIAIAAHVPRIRGQNPCVIDGDIRYR